MVEKLGGVFAMTFDELFKKIKKQFASADVSAIGEHLAYQFHIVGEAEGTFYVEVKDGELHIEPYEYHDRDAAFNTSAETLMKIATGKQDPIFAFSVGKLHIEGNLDKAVRLKEIIEQCNKKKGKKNS